MKYDGEKVNSKKWEIERKTDKTLKCPREFKAFVRKAEFFEVRHSNWGGRTLRQAWERAEKQRIFQMKIYSSAEKWN